MRKLKAIFIFLMIFFVIFISIYLVYKKIILTEEYVNAYVLNKDVSRGEVISKEDVYNIKIHKAEYLDDINLIKNEINENEVAQIDLVKGIVLTEDLFIKKEDYKFEDGKEIISINLDKKDIATNIKLEKGRIVNIYFIEENELDESKRVKLIAKNIRIIDVNDDEANSVSKSKNASKLIVSLSSEKVMLINRYNKKGGFNVSLVN